MPELLSLMKEGSRAIKPRDLGVIGKDHLAANSASVGAAPESFDYRCAAFEHEGLPYVIEAAFGYCPHGFDERRIITGRKIGRAPDRRREPHPQFTAPLQDRMAEARRTNLGNAALVGCRHRRRNRINGL